MGRPKPISPDKRSWLLLALCASMELPIALWAFGGTAELGLFPALLLHLAASGTALFVPPKGPGWLNPRRQWGDALAAWTFVLPGVGWLLAFPLYLRHARGFSSKGDAAMDDLLAGEDEGLELLEATPAQAAEKLREAIEMMPAVDVLFGPDSLLKRGAIETLTKIRTPQAIEWLLNARSDQNPEIRFYATSALTALKRDFEKDLHTAEKEIFARPAELRPQLTFHRIQREYALSGLVDRATKKELLERSRTRLAGWADMEADALLELYETQKELDPEAALKLLDQLRAKQKSPAERIRWMKEEAELLFRLSRHRDVARLMKELDAELASSGQPLPLLPQDSDWSAAVLWWRGAPGG